MNLAKNRNEKLFETIHDQVLCYGFFRTSFLDSEI